MTSKVLVSGVIAVCSVSLFVFFVEFFIPISAKYDLDIYCRNALLSMEESGGLKEETKADLVQKLTEAGFANVNVSGTINARQGEKLNLLVEADYRYSALTGLFVRKPINQKMFYDKTAISRKVVN